LLQYDTNSKKYDLHPVVRGVVAGSLTPEETNLFGQLVLDHLSRQPHDPYEGARSLEDVQIGLHIVRVLLKMGRYKEACKAYRGDLEAGLLVNLESYPEVLTLLRPFFPMGWAHLPKGVCRYDASSLLNSVTVALSNTGALTDSLGCSAVLIGNVIRCKDWAGLSISLSNLGACLRNQNRLAQSNRCRDLNLSVAELMGGSADIFRARLECFGTSSLLGEWEKAEKLWNLLDTMGRDWGRATYRLGNAEQWYARFLFWQGRLSEEGLLRTELLASEGKDRKIIRSLHNLRGQWHVKRSEWEPAANSFGEAVAMDRHVAQIEPDAEMRLTLAKFHLGQLHSPRQEAERLSKADRGDHQALAELWLAIGDRERAKQHALKAHKGACADGEPYVLRYSLDEACALLKALGVDIPPTPIYDPIKDGKFPMEDEVIAVVEQLRREKAGSRINPGVTR
jgi:tetratricopeptide (TPR) repeat protein